AVGAGYAQLLHLEIQNLRAAAYRWRRNFSALSFSNPLILAALPLLTSLIRRRRAGSGRRKLKVLTAALFGWRMLRNTIGLLSRFVRKSRGRHSQSEEQSAAI